MSDINYHKQVFNIIQPIDLAVIDASFIEIEHSQDKIKSCQVLGIETEVIQNKVRLLNHSIQTQIFKDIDSFLAIRKINDNSNFLIIHNHESISFINNETYLNFVAQPNNYLITNTRAYLEFLELLKNQESETDDAFHFVDSYNKDLRKISFVSLSEKGRVTLTYNLKAPQFDNLKDLRIGLKKFQSCFENENKSLPKFLKSAVINTASNYPHETRLKQLFENIEEVVEKARINFEVYLNNLSIDKIKKDYDEVKSKYFNSLSDILSKLSQKIIALPIGISATLFAVDKVKDVPFFLAFLIGAIVITSVYISLLLRVHFKDLLYISKIFHYDYKILIENNFFTKYPEERKLFDEIKNRLNDRIKFLKIIIESYYWIMNIANIIIVAIILDNLKIRSSVITIIFLIALITLTIIRNYILEKDEEEQNGGLAAG